MARKRNRSRRKLVENLQVTNMAAEGKAFGRRADGKLIFVENAVPGDVVNVLLTKNKKDYGIGKIADLLEASELRQPAFCEHFGVCGGCKWQYLAYEQQLEYKRLTVEESFRRIGKLDFPEIPPVLGSELTTYYRNKLDFTFSNKRWLTREEVDSGVEMKRDALGFHKPGMFDKVVDVNHCHLQAEPSNEIRNHVRDFALKHELEFYDIREHTGMLRNLIIRSSTQGELMVILSVAQMNPMLFTLLDDLLEHYPDITSLHYVVNKKKNDTLYDQDIITYHGRGYILETLGHRQYKISPKSFFQTNPTQAKSLYDITRDFAELKGEEIVYDLYTGTGSIAIYVADQCAKVVGIEEVEAAIVDAKFNASLNEVSNGDFYAGDVKEMLTDAFAEQHGRPDVLITDPPRAGMHPDVLVQLCKLAPQRIVYVSCNPVTQARDLSALCEQGGYKITKVQPVDMFPHTYHIENVVALEKI